MIQVSIRLYCSDQQRTINVGKIVAEQLEIVVPPRSPSTVISGHMVTSRDCGPEKPVEYRIILATAFMGFYGKWTKLTVAKADGSTAVIHDAPYQQNGSNTVIWSLAEGEKISNNDEFHVECTYDTAMREEWVSSSLWFTIDYVDWYYYTKNNAGETCAVEMEVIPRHDGQNFLQIGSYGLLDTCGIR